MPTAAAPATTLDPEGQAPLETTHDGGVPLSDGQAASPETQEDAVPATNPPTTKNSERKPSAPGRLDQRTARDTWQIALWAKGEVALVEKIIAQVFTEPRRPVVQDDHWLRVTGAQQARVLVAGAVAERDARTNAYHGWLLDLLITQLRQAFPAVEAPDSRPASRVATALNEMRPLGQLADWRAFTPPGPTKLSYLLYWPDGSQEAIERPTRALKRIEAVRGGNSPAYQVAVVAAPADEVGKRRAARDANSTPPVVTDANVVKVSLGTTAQETMADQLFTDQAVATRSGRSLLIVDQAAVVKTLQDGIEAIDSLPANTEAGAKRVAAMRRRTMEALLGRVHSGLLVD